MHPERSKGNFSGIIIAVIVILLIAAVVFGVITVFFHRAYITVTPQTYAASIEDVFEASLEDPLIPYRVVSVQETLTKTVAATGSEEVENRASGTVTVYNAFSTSPERLITNTRFQTADGLIYRVHTPITVPGYTMKAGAKVPGSIDVTVYAFEPGEKYNIGLQDFTIPGLKGSQQHELMYARSKTAMAGGFVGKMAVVDEKVRETAVLELKTGVERSLREKIAAAAPEGNLIFADTVSVSFSEGTDALSGEGAVISVSGTASAPSFPETNFARAIAESTGIDSESLLSIQNPGALSVHVATPEVLGTETPVEVSISGQANLVAIFNVADLARDLGGRNKEAVNTVLPAYPGIADVVVKIYPFWRSSIPKNHDYIDVEVATPGTEVGG